MSKVRRIVQFYFSINIKKTNLIFVSRKGIFFYTPVYKRPVVVMF